jgi:acyl-CoA synthetase (AMP-forming)/AMP-acid ligase II
VLDQGQTLSDRLIKKECLARLENFMVPKKIVVLDELPKTNTGKTDKQALSELASHG